MPDIDVPDVHTLVVCNSAEDWCVSVGCCHATPHSSMDNCTDIGPCTVMNVAVQCVPWVPNPESQDA